MPVIPQFQKSSQLRTGQGPSLSAVSAVSQAVGQLGGEVSRQANVAIQKQKDADDAAFVTKQTNRMLRQESERLADIQTRGAEVDMASLQNDFNERVSLLAEDAPSQEARNELLSQADNAYTRKFFPSYASHQSGINVQKRVNSFQSGIDDIQSEVLTGRTGVAEAVARTEAALVGLQETAGGVVDIDKARLSAFNEIAVNALGGRIDRGDGRSVIAEVDAGKWDALTDSQTLARIRRAAQSDIKQRDAAAKQQFAQGFDDYVAFLSSGKEDASMADRYSPENIISVFGAEKGAQLVEAVQDSRAFGQALNEIKTASPDELRAIVERERPTSAEGFRRESAQFNNLNKAIKARNSAIADDPSLYVMQNSNIATQAFQRFQESFNAGDAEGAAAAAKEFAAIQRSTQEELGVPSQGVQILTKQFGDAVVAQLSDFSQGGESVALQMDALKGAFGAEWGTVQRQLQQSDKMGGGLRVMSGMDFGPEMIKLGEALSIPQNDYKEVIGADDFKDIKAGVIDELSAFQDTLRGQPGAEAVFTQHKTAIETLAMKYIADGTFGDTTDAIEKAKSDVLDSRFEFKGTYRVPTKFNADNVESGVSEIIDQIGSGGIELTPPESDNVTNLDDRMEVYLSVLRPVPITSPNGEGVLFTDQNGKALLQPNGDPLIIPWEQLSAPATDSESQVPSAF